VSGLLDRVASENPRFVSQIVRRMSIEWAGDFALDSLLTTQEDQRFQMESRLKHPFLVASSILDW